MTFRRYCFWFTCCFLLCALLVFAPYYLSGKTLIQDGDGIRQHFRTLLFYSDYLQNTIKGLLHGEIVSPQWCRNLGDGADILLTLHYYGIGEPLTFLSVLVPNAWMATFYSFAIVLRIYLAGIFFSLLCFETTDAKWHAVLIGALFYSYSAWFFTLGLKHPFFLLPLIYTPLIIWTVERIIRGKSALLFSLSVFLTAVSNIYFLYMIAIACVIYFVVRLFFLGATRRKKAQIFVKVLLYGILGLAMASMILLPMLRYLLLNNRLGVQYGTHVLFPREYYLDLVRSLLSTSGALDLHMKLTGSILLSVIALFCIRFQEKKALKVYVAIACIFLILPACSSALNGFSYVSNRWSWMLSLLFCYTFVAVWNHIIEMQTDELRRVIGGGIFLAFLILATCVISRGGIISMEVQTEIVLLVLTVCFLWLVQHRDLRWRTSCWTAICIIGLVDTLYWNVTASDCLRYNAALTGRVIEDSVWNNEYEVVKEVAMQDGVGNAYRTIGAKHGNLNGGLNAGISVAESYWSITNPYITGMRSALEILGNYSYQYRGYNNSASLTALSNVVYYLRGKEADFIPTFGFEFVRTDTYGDEDDLSYYSLFRNMNAMLPVYAYDSVITEAEAERFDPVQRRDLLLQSAIIEDAKPVVLNWNGQMPQTESIPHTIEVDDAIRMSDNSFTVAEKDTSIRLRFEPISGSEVYARITGLYADTSKDEEGYWDTGCDIEMESSAGDDEMLHYKSKDSTDYSGQHDFTICFGCEEKPVDSITIRFAETGEYRYDTLTVMSQPMDTFDEKIRILRGHAVIENLEISDDTISFDVTTEENTLLCSTTPYLEGWEAFIDSEQTDVVRSNYAFVGCECPSGRHHVVFRYHRKLQSVGWILSVIAFAILASKVASSERRGCSVL